jgi:hypothetical protein
VFGVAAAVDDANDFDFLDRILISIGMCLVKHKIRPFNQDACAGA